MFTTVIPFDIPVANTSLCIAVTTTFAVAAAAAAATAAADVTADAVLLMPLPITSDGRNFQFWLLRTAAARETSRNSRTAAGSEKAEERGVRREQGGSREMHRRAIRNAATRKRTFACPGVRETKMRRHMQTQTHAHAHASTYLTNAIMSRKMKCNCCAEKRTSADEGKCDAVREADAEE